MPLAERQSFAAAVAVACVQLVRPEWDALRIADLRQQVRWHAFCERVRQAAELQESHTARDYGTCESDFGAWAACIEKLLVALRAQLRKRRRGGRKGKTLTVKARREALLDLFKRDPSWEGQRGKLARRFEVSLSTISRDLKWLWEHRQGDMARILGEPKRAYRKPGRRNTAEREPFNTWTLPDGD